MKNLTTVFLLLVLCFCLKSVSGAFSETNNEEKSKENVWPSFVLNAINLEEGLQDCMLQYIVGTKKLQNILPILETSRLLKFR